MFMRAQDGQRGDAFGHDLLNRIIHPGADITLFWTAISSLVPMALSMAITCLVRCQLLLCGIPSQPWTGPGRGPSAHHDTILSYDLPPGRSRIHFAYFQQSKVVCVRHVCMHM